MDVAVIGAGLAGLSCARALADAGHTVVVWEKSRGAGGRTSTRRGPDGLRFDHGAPALHGVDDLPALARHTATLPGGATFEATVGRGSMNAAAKALADGLTLRAGVRVCALRRDGRPVLVDDDGGELARVDAVVVTAPAPQTADLLAGVAPALAARARAVDYHPCWTAMLAFDAPLDLGFTAARDEHDLAWAVAEAPKPGRAPGERWVLQADPAFSAESLEDDAEDVLPALLERFAALAGRGLPDPSHLVAHRWRYATPASPLDAVVLRDGDVLAAGDWCAGTDAGAAVRSGRAAAAALAGQFSEGSSGTRASRA